MTNKSGNISNGRTEGMDKTTTGGRTDGMERTAHSLSDYPEIGDIREDIDTLKSDVLALTRHVGADGAGQIRRAGKIAQEKWMNMQDAGRMGMERVQDVVKEKPVQGIAVAFCAGFLLSALMCRK